MESVIELQRLGMGIALALLCLALAGAIIGLLFWIRRKVREEAQGGYRSGDRDDAVVAGNDGADPVGGRVVVEPGNKTLIQVIEVPAPAARRAPDYGSRYAGKNGNREDAVRRQGRGR